MKQRALRLIVPVALLTVLAFRFDLGGALRSLTELSPTWLAASLAAFLFMLALRATRWVAILHWLGLEVPYRKALLSFALGLASSTLVGDALGSFGRIYDLRDSKRDATTIGYAVVFDKAYELLILLAFVPMGILFIPDFPLRLSPAVAVGLAAVIVGASAVLLSPKRTGQLGSLLRIHRLEKIGDLGSGLSRHGHAIVVALSVAARAMQFLFVWLLARGLTIGLSYLEISAVMTFVGIAVLIPVSINGLGLRDVTMASLFTLVGEAPESALSLSIGVFLITSAFRLTAGLIWSAQTSGAEVRQ